MILMPVAGWLLGTLARAPFPVPAVLAAATLPYMFGTEYSIYGGNIASTLAGRVRLCLEPLVRSRLPRAW